MKRRALLLVGAAALLGAIVGWFAGEATIPSKEWVKQETRALVPPGSQLDAFFAVSGIKLLVGTYRVQAEFTGGAETREALLDTVRSQLTRSGWSIEREDPLPAVVTLRMRRGDLAGIVGLIGPPAHREVGGSINVRYADGVDDRASLGGRVGAVAGAVIALVAVVLLVLRRRRSSSGSAG